MVDLSKRFPACAIVSTSTVNPIIPFYDKFLRKIKLNPDLIHTNVEKIYEQATEKSSNYDSTKSLKFENFIEVKDGIYQGTTIDGLQTGFGRMLFNDNVNYHPEIITKALN